MAIQGHNLLRHELASHSERKRCDAASYSSGVHVWQVLSVERRSKDVSESSGVDGCGVQSFNGQFAATERPPMIWTAPYHTAPLRQIWDYLGDGDCDVDALFKVLVRDEHRKQDAL